MLGDKLGLVLQKRAVTGNLMCGAQHQLSRRDEDRAERSARSQNSACSRSAVRGSIAAACGRPGRDARVESSVAIVSFAKQRIAQRERHCPIVCRVCTTCKRGNRNLPRQSRRHTAIVSTHTGRSAICLRGGPGVAREPGRILQALRHDESAQQLEPIRPEQYQRDDHGGEHAGRRSRAVSFPSAEYPPANASKKTPINRPAAPQMDRRPAEVLASCPSTRPADRPARWHES